MIDASMFLIRGPCEPPKQALTGFDERLVGFQPCSIKIFLLFPNDLDAIPHDVPLTQNGNLSGPSA